METELNLKKNEEFPSYLPLREVVLRQLKEAIIDGTLRPGQLLSENRIAASLNVSRTPVREAIRSLEAENLVQILQGRKIIVSIPTLKDIEEVYHIRMILETAAIAKIKCEQTEIINELKAYVTEAKNCLLKKDIKGLSLTNTKFHKTLIQSLDNDRLLQFSDSLNDTISRFRVFSLMDDEWAEKGVEEHHIIVCHLESGQQEKATNALKDHLSRAVKILIEMFKEENSYEKE